MARRRVVVMASGMTVFAAMAGMLGPRIALWMHLPVRSVVLALLALEIAVFALVLKAFVQLRQDEARDGSV